MTHVTHAGGTGDDGRRVSRPCPEFVQSFDETLAIPLHQDINVCGPNLNVQCGISHIVMAIGHLSHPINFCDCPLCKLHQPGRATPGVLYGRIEPALFPDEAHEQSVSDAAGLIVVFDQLLDLIERQNCHSCPLIAKGT